MLSRTVVAFGFGERTDPAVLAIAPNGNILVTNGNDGNNTLDVLH